MLEYFFLNQPIQKIIRCVSVYLLVSFLFLFPFYIWNQDKSEQKGFSNLEYNIDVVIQYIPFYAVDDKGSPVYDLNENDIVLFLNGKKQDILNLSHLKFTEQKKKQYPIKKKGRVPERFVFIVFDKIFNSESGIIQSKKIVQEIIESASPGDSFVFFEISKAKGLFYKIGPTKNKKKLIAILESVEDSMLNGSRLELSPFTKGILSGTTLMVTEEDYLFALRQLRIMKEKYAKRSDIYNNAISALKNVLHTINHPKLIYLVSEGMKYGYTPRKKWIKNLKKLKKTAKELNESKTMLFVVNSKISLFDKKKDSHMLKYLAKESGGQYFSGSNQKKNVEQLKSATGAYYEIAYDPKDIRQKKNTNVRLKCNRNGIKLYSIKQTKIQIPYVKMKRDQKQIFVINLINGGSWSRSLGKSKKAENIYTEIIKSNKKRVQLLLPTDMRNRKLDVFVLNINPKTYKTEIDFFKRICGKKIRVDVDVQNNKDQYLVLVEPNNVYYLFKKI